MKTIEVKPPAYYPTFTARAVNKETRTITMAFATEAVALDRGVLKSDGADFSRFLLNPTFFLDHNTAVENKAGVVKAIRQSETEWEGDFVFAPPEVSRKADDAFRFLDWSKCGATSVGFIVTDRNSNPSESERARYGLPPNGWIGNRWTPLEISIVGIGSDPKAVMRSGGAKARAVRAMWAQIGLRDFEAWKAKAMTRTSNDVAAEIIETAKTGTLNRESLDEFAKIRMDEMSNDDGSEAQEGDTETGGEGSIAEALQPLIDGMLALGSKLDQVIEMVSSSAKKEEPTTEMPEEKAATADFWRQIEEATTKAERALAK